MSIILMQREEGEMSLLPVPQPRMEVRQHRQWDQADPHSSREKLLKRGEIRYISPIQTTYAEEESRIPWKRDLKEDLADW